jgi:Bacterial protein of unknown function (DUF885)
MEPCAPTTLKSAGIAGAAALFLVVSAWSFHSRTPDRAAATSAWKALVHDWIESDMRAQPLMAVDLGRHEYDGLFPDWSESGLAAEVRRLKRWRARVVAFDALRLPDAMQFERDYLLAVIDSRLFWQHSADWPHRNPTWYYLDPAVYLDRPYADLATRMQAYTRWAEHLPAAAAQIKANLKGPLPRVYIDVAVNTFGPLARYLQSKTAQTFDGVDDGVAHARFARLNAAAIAALVDLTNYMRGLRATQTEDFELGPELFAKMLYATERVDTPLYALQEIGEQDLHRNQAALAEACARFAPGQSLMQCAARVEQSKPEGGDCVAFAVRQLVQLRRFVQERNVVSIPGAQEEAEVKRSPPYNAQERAYIAMPGPYERNLPAFYNVAAPDPLRAGRGPPARIPGEAELLFSSVHEVWPGHFLQFLHSNRASSPLGTLYVGYAFAEGWAHYTEEMMWEEGLGNGDPEVHIGELLDALLRDVRFLSSIGMHTRGMTLADSRLMFLEDAYQSEATAEQQAVRGTYDPAYLNYTLGKLMIRRLRADWCGARGNAQDRACWHDFHDAFLSYGGPPIPLVRGAMLGEPADAVY